MYDEVLSNTFPCVLPFSHKISPVSHSHSPYIPYIIVYDNPAYIIAVPQESYSTAEKKSAHVSIT